MKGCCCDSILAAENGNKALCKLLIPKMNPETINAVTQDGKTALHIAAKQGTNEVCELLIPNMTSNDIKVHDAYNKTALYYAQENGFDSITNAIQSKLLTLAIKLDEAEKLINEMSEQGLARTDKEGNIENNINWVDKYNQTVLHHASSNGNIKIVEHLLKNGADVNLKDDSDITALQLAVLDNHKDVVAVLLKNNADPNVKGYSGLTALHIAAENGNIEILTQLIESGGNAKAVNDHKSSVMHSVAVGIIEGKDKCWELIKVLYEKQVDPLAENDMGKSARDLLEEYDLEYADTYDDKLVVLGYYDDSSD